MSGCRQTWRCPRLCRSLSCGWRNSLGERRTGNVLNNGLLIFVFLVSAALGSAAVYSVTDLGRLTNVGGRTESGPKGINIGGTIACVNGVGGSYRALMFAGGWTNLGTLGGDESLSAGLNDSAQVVGYSVDAGGVTHGFLWTAGGLDGVPGNPQMKDLGTLDGGPTQAYGINNQGHVTGYSDVVEKNKVLQHAFVWRNGTMTDIGILLGTSSPNSFGYGINASAHVAGTAYNSSYSSASAFVYDGNSARDIGGLGGSNASALALNDADQVTGYATTSNGFDHAFRYSGGVMRDLGTLGGHYSYGLGINNHATIVGGSFIDANDTVYHAFVWSNNVMRDLNGLLDATGSGWVLVEARAINDLGQIVGSGTYLGVNHAFLLSPIQSKTAPLITSVEFRGSDMLVRFTTDQNALYSVQATAELANRTWTTVKAGIAGTGGVVETAVPVQTYTPGQFLRIERTL